MAKSFQKALRKSTVWKNVTVEMAIFESDFSRCTNELGNFDMTLYGYFSNICLSILECGKRIEISETTVIAEYGFREALFRITSILQ